MNKSINLIVQLILIALSYNQTIAEEFDDEGFATENSEVKVYYGASDTSVGLATSTVEKLIKQCYE